MSAQTKLPDETALDKFLRYVKVDTQSQEDSQDYPSTAKQLNLANMLVQELKDLGLQDARVDKYGYVMATLPANLPKNHEAFGKVPQIGFISHMDTSPDVSGTNVKAQVIKKYDGKDIVLPGDPSIVIRTSENPELAKNIGKTIVTSDGTTLLGADDKAGIAAIMSAVQTLVRNPKFLHGEIKIGFTPDEEVGRGTDYFDIKAFGADFAYTVDGGTTGELNKETFSANAATITVHGRDIHPGTAKGIMVNSIRVMADIIARLPKNIAPETTEGYEPYIHPEKIDGATVKSSVKFLLRDFETEGLKNLEQMLRGIISEVEKLHPKARIELEIKESYRNMRYDVEKEPRLLTAMWEATRRAGVEPFWKPIRGGTDGSRLTEKGLLTPNLFTGGENYHSRTEWVSVYGMEKSAETIVNLVQVWVELAGGK
ncbi:MAG: peptidase T [Ignavibacteria bacterium]|nr:peptidase T [Ignavibacteria bacterium]